jgi:hypothetical protein
MMYITIRTWRTILVHVKDRSSLENNDCENTRINELVSKMDSKTKINDSL